MTMPLPDGVPACAEKLDYIECKHLVEAPSRFAPQRMVKVDTFACVACGEPMPLLELKETVTCPKCGLHMRREMLGDLFIWRDEKVPA